MVRSGVVDRAIVGGTESAIAPGIMRAWEAMRVLTPDACRPFSLGRNGMVLGEGAGIIIVESAAAARCHGVLLHLLNSSAMEPVRTLATWYDAVLPVRRQP